MFLSHLPKWVQVIKLVNSSIKSMKFFNQTLNYEILKIKEYIDLLLKIKYG